MVVVADVVVGGVVDADGILHTVNPQHQLLTLDVFENVQVRLLPLETFVTVVVVVVEKSNNIKSTDVTQLLLFKVVFQIIIHNVRKVHPFFVNAGCWYGEAFHVDRLPPSPSFLLRVCRRSGVGHG